MQEPSTPKEILATATTVITVYLNDRNPMDIALKEFLEIHRVVQEQNSTNVYIAFDMVAASQKIQTRATEILHLHLLDIKKYFDEQKTN